jgi:membrane protein
MANLAQLVTRCLRNLTQTSIARALQMVSELLGRFSPGVQTRIVRWVQMAVEVHAKSRADDVSTHAAALTYAAFLSTVPLIMLGLALTGGLLRSSTADADWFSQLVGAIPGLASLIESKETQLTKSATGLGLIGLIGVLWTASVLSSRATRALAVVFGLPQRSVVNRVRALGVTIGLGIALFVSLGLTGLILAIETRGVLSVPAQLLSSLALLLLEVGYFTLAYWLLTPRRELWIVDHVSGGVLMASGWNVLKYLGAFFCDRMISRASALYGTLGAVFGLLLFIRVTMWLFLYGAEVNSLVRAIRREDRNSRQAQGTAGSGSSAARVSKT